MKKTLKVILSCVLLAAASSTLAAKPTSWQNSYTQEASGKYAEAAQSIEKFLRHKQAGEYANMRTGWLEYLQGNYSKAITHYKQALKFNPKSVDARLGMIPPLIAQQRWKEVKYAADKALKEAPGNYQAHLYLMLAEEQKRQWQTLRNHAEKVTRMSPSAADAWVYLARAELNLGNTRAAKTAYSHVLARYPAHYEATAFFNSQKNK